MTSSAGCGMRVVFLPYMYIYIRIRSLGSVNNISQNIRMHKSDCGSKNMSVLVYMSKRSGGGGGGGGQSDKQNGWLSIL